MKILYYNFTFHFSHKFTNYFQETGGLVISLKIGLTVIDDTINGFLKPVNKQVSKVKVFT